MYETDRLELRADARYEAAFEQAAAEALEVCRAGCIYLLPDEDGPYCFKLQGPVPERQEDCPRVQKYPVVCRSCKALTCCTDEEIEKDHAECESEQSSH